MWLVSRFSSQAAALTGELVTKPNSASAAVMRAAAPGTLDPFATRTGPPAVVIGSVVVVGNTVVVVDVVDVLDVVLVVDVVAGSVGGCVGAWVVPGDVDVGTPRMPEPPDEQPTAPRVSAAITAATTTTPFLT